MNEDEMYPRTLAFLQKLDELNIYDSEFFLLLNMFDSMTPEEQHQVAVNAFSNGRMSLMMMVYPQSHFEGGDGFCPFDDDENNNDEYL